MAMSLRRCRRAIVAAFCYRARKSGGGKFTMATQSARGRNGSLGWSVSDSLDLYGVPAWGSGYFSVNAAGHVVVRPDTTEREIDLYDVVQGLQQRDLTAPVVVRFSDILAHRLRYLHDAFARAIAENDYRNRYAAVFPIKVNQQRLVVEEVFRYGKEFGFGLEAGSKPELLAVMAMSEASPDRLIVCNGFKDSSYIEAVILATKLGRCIVPVVENFAELDLILKHAAHYGVRPKIGVRVKLSSEGLGPVERIGRGEIEVRPVRHRNPRAGLGPEGAWHGGLPQAGALPSGQPAAGHPAHQGRHR
jgi:arginine decarboxylase-like protein